MAPDSMAQYAAPVLSVDSLGRLVFVGPTSRDFVRDPETDLPIAFPTIGAAAAAWQSATAAARALSTPRSV